MRMATRISWAVTIVLGSNLSVVERMHPPRVLHCEFPLGRPLGKPGDAEFQQAFVRKLLPAAQQFRPDFVLISAGFDAHPDDPLGRLKVTTDEFAGPTRRW